MEMHDVVSSNMGAIGYDPATRILRIKFKKNKTHMFDYLDVPPEVYNKLEKAPSRGKFFQANIKSFYNFNKVEIVHEKESI